MYHAMTVLGWAQDFARLPRGIGQHRHGVWNILVAEDTSPHTARERLALQVECFDAGINFLPAAPAKELTLCDAIKAAQSNLLCSSWQRLLDRGQFSLLLSKNSIKQRQPNDGRSWLLARKAQKENFDWCDAFLKNIAQQLDLPTTPPRLVARATQCDFLVNRAGASHFRSDISRIVNTLDGRSDMSLSVTGLWPPLGFTDLTKTTEVTA